MGKKESKGDKATVETTGSKATVRPKAPSGVDIFRGRNWTKLSRKVHGTKAATSSKRTMGMGC